MIETSPSLDEIQKYYENYQKQIKELKILIDDFSKKTSLNTIEKFTISTLSYIFSFMDNEAGMNVGNIKLINKITEMIEQKATKEQVQEQMQIIEKKVIDTLVPMSDLLKNTKEIQDKNVDYIG
ncbi:MAG: hypothetical protein WD717_07050 [Nitrosarchaeum sp.]